MKMQAEDLVASACPVSYSVDRSFVELKPFLKDQKNDFRDAEAVAGLPLLLSG